MLTLSELMTEKEGFDALVMGNHALARAMAEAGTMVVTSYPGSPTPEIAEALQAPAAGASPVHFEFAVNEKVALEIAAGASLNGRPSAVFFKSVGLNVASDSMAQLALMELQGGMVVILGDDPGANSSQNEQDNRWFARMSYLPVFEPASPSEVRAMYLEAAALAKERRTAVILRLTTHVCHAREKVAFGPLPSGAPDWTPRFDPKLGPYVPITSSVFPLKARALKKLAGWENYGNRTPLNVLHRGPAGRRRLGAVSAGLPALCLLEAVRAAGAPVDVFKLGLSYPLPAGLMEEFLRTHDEVFVFEELDRVMETELKALAYDKGLACRIHARRSAEELMGEASPARAAAALASAWPDLFKRAGPRPVQYKTVPRPPQMCPGCGHRSAFHAVKKALPPGTITVGDIGCHSLGFLPPYGMGEVLFSMGHSVSTAAGLALNNASRKVAAFVGDSTFFHAGMPGTANAAWRDSDITLVLLDNGTTAMTGHQPRPGNGELGEKLSLPDLLKALGVKFVRECGAYEQEKLAGLVKEAMDHKGFAVVIARHPCMLKFMRDRRRADPALKAQHVDVDQGKCARHYTCVADFACPSFIRNADGSVTVNPELCIGDGSCIQTCPVKAIGRGK